MVFFCMLGSPRYLPPFYPLYQDSHTKDKHNKHGFFEKQYPRVSFADVTSADVAHKQHTNIQANPVK